MCSSTLEAAYGTVLAVDELASIFGDETEPVAVLVLPVNRSLYASCRVMMPHMW